MKKAIYLINLILAAILIVSQAADVSAAPAYKNTGLISGVVQGITLETNASTGVTTVLVTISIGEVALQTIRIRQKTALELDLVTLDEDGKPVIHEEALGWEVEIDAKDVIPDKEVLEHPIGSALATFFSDIPGLDYDTVMNVHGAGNGFGVIAQALWLTRILGGDSQDFLDIIEAKKSGDFSDFMFDDGTSPLNWGQFRKAILDKKDNPGVINSSREKNSGNADNHGNDNDHGNGTNNSNNHGTNSNGNNKPKDKNNDENRNGNNPGNGNSNRP